MSFCVSLRQLVYDTKTHEKKAGRQSIRWIGRVKNPGLKKKIRRFYGYFVRKIFEVCTCKPEDYQRLVLHFVNCRLISPHDWPLAPPRERGQTGPTCYLQFSAKYTHLCFSPRKLSSYKTSLQSFFFLNTMQQQSLRGSNFRWCLNNEFFPNNNNFL